jgi:branched-chain amino acid transport system ATP-binding protein
MAGTAALTGVAEGERLSARAEPRSAAHSGHERKGVTALALEGVSLSFGGVAALKDIDVAFNDDAITAVIGPNGAGKTSLLNVITGFTCPIRGASPSRTARTGGRRPPGSPRSALRGPSRISASSRASRPATISRPGFPSRHARL